MPAVELDWLIVALSLIAIIYIAFVALVQQDMKKLIAYSSIAHMGFVTLGAFLVFYIIAATGRRPGRGQWPGWRGGADDLARPDLGRAVPLHRRACTTACTRARSAPMAA